MILLMFYRICLILHSTQTQFQNLLILSFLPLIFCGQLPPSSMQTTPHLTLRGVHDVCGLLTLQERMIFLPLCILGIMIKQCGRISISSKKKKNARREDIKVQIESLLVIVPRVPSRLLLPLFFVTVPRIEIYSQWIGKRKTKHILHFLKCRVLFPEEGTLRFISHMTELNYPQCYQGLDNYNL